jgi:hypothetical protein
MFGNFLKELKEVCDKRGFELKELGRVGENKEYPMFSITLNSSNFKKTVCFSAGIHGTEIAGPFAVLKFLKTVELEKYKDIKIILFPAANPSGFDKKMRRNYQGRDVSVHFCKEDMYGETKMLYDAVKNEDIFFFHALHEDPDETRFYLYNFIRDNLMINSAGNTHTPSSTVLEKIKSQMYPEHDNKIFHDILGFGKKYFEIYPDAIVDNYKCVNGIVTNRWDCSFEDRMFRNGVPYSICTETPERMELDKRIELNVEIMFKVLDFVVKQIK